MNTDSKTFKEPKLLNFIFHFCKFLAYLPLKLIFPFKIIGKKRLPKKESYVSISNHLSANDVIALELCLPGFRHFLAKKELGEKKLPRFFLKKFGAIFIDREKMDLKAIKTAIASLKKYPLSVFPEGTRNKSGEGILAVKGGAAMIAVKAGVSIYPIMLHHKSRVFRKNYLFVGERFSLPYSANDRFNNEAMDNCTGIISENMLKAKQELDNLVSSKGINAYNKELRLKIKADKKAERLAIKSEKAKKAEQ